MIETRDILETIQMIEDENLDIRTVTMGISLTDCIDPDIDAAAQKVYDKIAFSAQRLVPVANEIEKELGIPIINKRVSVTPVAMLCGATKGKDPVKFAYALEKASRETGVNFIGGYSALVQKGFAAGDKELIRSIPRALAETEHICASVNVGSTKAGINMDAVRLMGETVKQTALLTADRDCIGAAKLVVLCNAPDDNPFMAGAFHGVGEPDCVINVGVSGPGVVRSAISKAPTTASIKDTVNRNASATDAKYLVSTKDGVATYKRSMVTSALGQDAEFIYANTSNATNTLRFCDGDRVLVYFFDVTDKLSMEISLNIFQNYILEVSADGEDWEEIANYYDISGGQHLTSGGNNKVYKVNPFDYGCKQTGTCYIRLRNCDPSKGHGGSITNLTLNYTKAAK